MFLVSYLFFSANHFPRTLEIILGFFFHPLPVHCDQLSVLFSPKALEFRGHARLDVDSLPDVFGASLGYSVAKPTEWDGLTVRDPFNLANGVVVVVAEGIDSLKLEVRMTGRWEVS